MLTKLCLVLIPKLIGKIYGMDWPAGVTRPTRLTQRVNPRQHTPLRNHTKIDDRMACGSLKMPAASPLLQPHASGWASVWGGQGTFRDQGRAGGA